MPIQFAVGQSSLGLVLVAHSSWGICAVLLGENAGELLDKLHTQFPQENLIAADVELKPLLAKVIQFVNTPDMDVNFELDVRGTPFQNRVWKTLKTVPAGQTVSYSELAKKMGLPTGARAVASACAANTLAVLIPCHRVLRSNGQLSGYRWGVTRKKALLDIEKARTHSKGLAHLNNF